MTIVSSSIYSTVRERSLRPRFSPLLLGAKFPAATPTDVGGRFQRRWRRVIAKLTLLREASIPWAFPR